MQPGPAMEYLLTIVTFEGGKLVTEEVTQILVPVFPPNTTLSFSAGPIGGDYGQLIFGVRLGANMVPNAFTGYMQIWGTRLISGVVTATVLATELHGLVWVTEAQPTFAYYTNVSGLNQVFETYYAYLRVATENDYRRVIEELKHMATSEKSERLATEANQILRAIAGGEPAPYPPIQGGV